jgi:RHS repeat-associated protein
MNGKTIMRMRMLISSLLLLVAVLARAGEGGSYIVVLNPAATGEHVLHDADVTKAGGTITGRDYGMVYVNVSADGAALLAGHTGVKYVQAVGNATPVTRPAAATLMRRKVVAQQAAPTWKSGAYHYDGAGNIYAIGDSASADGDGHKTDYTYDELARLKVVQVSNATSGAYVRNESYGYNEYGNMTSYGFNNASPSTIHVSNANQLTDNPTTYDQAGNMTRDTISTYTWDAANMMVTNTHDAVTDVNLYTADDERVATKAGGHWTWSFRGLDGKVLRQYQSPASDPFANWLWVEDYVYVGGRLFAAERVAEEGGRRHFHLDHLGTPRLITDGNGRAVSQHDYTAFGLESTYKAVTSMRQEVAAGFDREDPMRFTGHERDFIGGTTTENENSLDYMHARFFTATMGRFLSVDPVLHADRALRSPKMWNRYAYAIDNPMVFTDPTGTTVYLVTYTTGNSQGDDEFRRAAQTRAAEIQHQKGYDAKHDTVIVAGVKTKADFAAAVKQANGMFKQFGKVGEVSLFSHAGWHDGPVFHDAAGKPTQFTASELDRVAVNWSDNAHACFFGCNTGVRFGSMFAESQRVTTYGFTGYASFSSNPNHYERIQPTGPVYMMTVPPHQLRGLGMTSPWPMSRDDP